MSSVDLSYPPIWRIAIEARLVPLIAPVLFMWFARAITNGLSSVLDSERAFALALLALAFPAGGIVIQNLLSHRLRREYRERHAAALGSTSAREKRVRIAWFLAWTSALVVPVLLWLGALGWNNLPPGTAVVTGLVLLLMIGAHAIQLPYDAGPEFPYSFSPLGRLVSAVGTYACVQYGLISLLLEGRQVLVEPVVVATLIGVDLARIALLCGLNLVVASVRDTSSLPQNWIGGRIGQGTALWFALNLGLVIATSQFMLRTAVPVLTTEPDHQGLGLTVLWLLSVPALLVSLPLSVLRPTGFKKPSDTTILPARGPVFRWVRAQWRVAVLSVVRAHLLVGVIVSHNIQYFVLSLPVSAVVTGALAWYLDIRIIGLWLATTLAWLGPFLFGLFFAEDTLTRAYTLGLQRSVNRLRGHVLVFGYGDIGRGYVRSLFDKGIFGFNTPLEHYALSTNILMPSGRLAKLFLSVAAVDKGHDAGVATELADRCPVALASLSDYFERKARRGAEGQGLTVAYGIPLIVGDATLDEIQGVAQISHASFLACLIRSDDGAESSQRVLDRLERQHKFTGKSTPAMFALHSSAFTRSVAVSALNHRLPLHYFTAPHLEGLNAANAAYGVFRKQTAHGVEPRVLVTGRTKRVLYFVDSFVRDLSFEESRAFWEKQNSKSPRIAVMSGDALFHSLSVAPEPDAWPDLSGLTAQGLSVRALRFSRLISRNPSTARNGVLGPAVFPTDVNVPLIRHEAFDYEPGRIVAKEWRPTIIVILDNDADNELKTMHALAAVLRRAALEEAGETTFQFPQILISGETGREDLQRRLKRRLTHYAAIAEPLVGGDGYPVQRMDNAMQRGDSWVDVLDEPTDRLAGMTEAYLCAPVKRVAEIVVCSSDSPGAIAKVMAGLGGYRLVGNTTTPRYTISIANVRIVPQRQGFTVRCQARLADPAARPESAPTGGHVARLGVVSAGVDLETIAGLVGLSAEPTARTRERALMNAVPLDRHRNSVSQCCGMHNCPIEPFHKLIEVASITLLGDDTRAERVEPFIRRFEVSSDFDKTAEEFVTALKSAPGLRYLRLPNDVPDDAAIANIELVCRQAAAPGAYGIALNSLLLRALEQDASVRSVFNTTYASAYECHDERFGVFTCIGFMTGQLSPLSVADVVGSVEIRPITGTDLWSRYQSELEAFIAQGLGPADKRPTVRIGPFAAPPPTPGAVN